MGYRVIAVFKDGTTINEEIDDRVAWAARWADLVNQKTTMYAAALEDESLGRPPIWHDKHYSGRETWCHTNGPCADNYSQKDGGNGELRMYARPYRSV